MLNRFAKTEERKNRQKPQARRYAHMWRVCSRCCLFLWQHHAKFVLHAQQRAEHVRIERCHVALRSLLRYKAGHAFSGWDVPDQVRFQVVLLPDPVNRVFAQALGLGHTSRAPVGGIGRRRVQGGVHDGLDLAVRNPGNTPRAKRILFETWQPKRQEALTPELHSGPRDAQGTCNILAPQPLGSFANNLGAQNQSEREASSRGPFSTILLQRRKSIVKSLRQTALLRQGFEWLPPINGRLKKRFWQIVSS
jgi:hypothetical protein